MIASPSFRRLIGNWLRTLGVSVSCHVLPLLVFGYTNVIFMFPKKPSSPMKVFTL